VVGILVPCCNSVTNKLFLSFKTLPSNKNSGSTPVKYVTGCKKITSVKKFKSYKTIIDLNVTSYITKKHISPISKKFKKLKLNSKKLN
jgi:hypothetical protein